MYTLLYVKGSPARSYCTAQGTLLSVRWQPGWEGSLQENGYIWLSPLAVPLKLSQYQLYSDIK